MKSIIKILLLCSLAGCKQDLLKVEVIPNLEEVTNDGYRYTPSTQSFIRGHHWLEKINTAFLDIGKDYRTSIKFNHNNKSTKGNYISLKNVPLNYLVPRLHYKINKNADEFDYFNLMMAEYSRNGLSFPAGQAKDEITHFETNLKADIPWQLEADFTFKPNPLFKPLRFSVVNNCLSPGLWELNAQDKTGEIYHAWFKFPEEKYYSIVADVNNIKTDNVKEALKWKNSVIKLDLDRLRTVKSNIGQSDIYVVDEDISYSSQGSRQKLSKGFVTCKVNEDYRPPEKLSDVITKPVKMAKFIPPGLYSMKEKMDFDFNFLQKPRVVKVREVDPLTSFNFDKVPFKRDHMRYVEIEIELPGKKKLILGNLPLDLMVQQEDFSLHGFGVGVLSAGGFAERRRFLIEQGFHPSFAYLAEETENGLIALNSHDKGLEQVFIRSYAKSDKPHWDITFTSYERITDIVKYRIDIHPELIEQQISHNDNYITPVYFSYRDDNIR